jgi:cytochrome c553
VRHESRTTPSVPVAVTTATYHSHVCGVLSPPRSRGRPWDGAPFIPAVAGRRRQFSWRRPSGVPSTERRESVKTTALCAAVTVLALATGVAQAATKSAAIDLVTRECSTCHGARGISVSPMFPKLAGQQAEYLAAQLKAFRDRSRADPHAQAFMWGMAAQLTDSTINEIAAYFASQAPERGAPADHVEIAAGKKIYEDGIEAQQVLACQICHGKNAEGTGLFPRLAGQHRGYLERQLKAFAANLRANDIMRENSKNLTALQISQVAAFLGALPAPIREVLDDKPTRGPRRTRFISD